jgi:hypothetical protein
MIAALMGAPGIAAAQSEPVVTVTPAFHQAIPNIPVKSLVAVIVAYPPAGKSPPHHHAR